MFEFVKRWWFAQGALADKNRLLEEAQQTLEEAESALRANRYVIAQLYEQLLDERRERIVGMAVILSSLGGEAAVSLDLARAAADAAANGEYEVEVERGDEVMTVRLVDAKEDE